jgi:hypothetical protein
MVQKLALSDAIATDLFVFVLPLVRISRALLSRVVFVLMLLRALFGLGQAIALRLGLQDMDPMGEAVQQGAVEAFGAKDSIQISKGQVDGKHHEPLLMSAIYT